jgi:acetate---CoA ligase (ADP-forming)
VSLDVLLNPRSIAVIGASDDPGKIGGRPLMYLARFGYRGRVLPVNPNRPEVQGLECYPDVASLPEVPELAAVVVPGEAAVKAVEDLGAAGTEVAIVMASGFGEVGGDGAVLQERLRQAAQASGLRLIGPNAMGSVNFSTGTVLTFTTIHLEVEPRPGPIGIVSQSGSMAVEPYALLARQGLGVRQTHATGNDADVTAAEVAAIVARDPEIQLVILYVESVGDGAALAELGRISCERDLPVIVLKGGRTAAGKRAAQSHTGALASEDRVVDTFFERYGIWRARDLEEVTRVAGLHLRGWRPKGTRIAVMSNSGASCVQAADAATDWGLSFAELTTETTAALADALPSFATLTNPVDLTAALIGSVGLFDKVASPLAADPSVDALHLALPIAGQGYEIGVFADTLAAVAVDKPVVVSSPMPDHVSQPFRDAGLPVFLTETEAIGALGSLLGHQARLAGAKARFAGSRPFEARWTPVGGTVLHEAASMAFLAAAGLPMVEHRLCQSAHEAVDAFRSMGAVPVAVKGCSADVTHKSELGIVRLNLTTEEDVRIAFDEVRGANGAIVARMVRGRRELLLGLHHHRGFGPVVLVGDGGRYVEALPDVRVLVPPFTVADVIAAVGQLRIAPVLRGTRGEPAVDIASVATAAVRLGAIADQVVSVDVNPLIVNEDGCVAADAVVIVPA